MTSSELIDYPPSAVATGGFTEIGQYTSNDIYFVDIGGPL